MSSIIEGYNYDIFISYRQKDNKQNGWVTELVDNLKGELESTFKEEISIYFDINPHDGLLETHDVDASLKEKLKCLLFIPIISRTYCDPKSFAWEHEFRAFIELASRDKFGIKVRLPNGNVASRVLPIRIHELDKSDIEIYKSVLGSVMRGVEFIYKSAGVNRPLQSKEDNPHDNLDRTIYRDQLNKVANAINEIISGLQRIQAIPIEEVKDEMNKVGDGRPPLKKTPAFQPFGEKAFDEQQTKKAIKATKKRWIYFLPSSVIVILAVIALYLFSSGSTLPFSKRDWIVITDFDNLTKNPVFDKSLYTAFSLSTNQSRYINVFPRSRILETLKRMKIKDRESIDDKTGREIAIREGIDIYIVPSISEVGNRYVITAKIVETKTGNLLRSEILYAETQDEILTKIDQLSKKIRRHLGESRYNIAAQDKPLKMVTTSSLEALKLYSLGTDHHLILDFAGAKDYYEHALQVDSSFTAAKASLGSLLVEKFDSVKKGRELLNEAIKSIDNLTEREKLGILAFYAVNVENNLSKGIKYAKMRIELYPDDPVSRNNLGWYYLNSGQFDESLKEYKAAVRINPNLAIAYSALIWIYLEKLGKADSSLVWSKKMILDNPQNIWGYIHQGSAYLSIDSLKKAEIAYEKALEIDPIYIITLYRLAHTFRLQGSHIEAIGILKKILELDHNESLAYYDMGVNYQLMGNKDEAKKYFSNFKRIATEELIKTEPDYAETYIAISATSARLGDMDYSQKMLLKAIEIDSTLHNRFAEVLCLQGKIPEALNQLERAFDNGYRDLFLLKLSPDMQILFYDIRFRNLLEKYF